MTTEIKTHSATMAQMIQTPPGPIPQPPPEIPPQPSPNPTPQPPLEPIPGNVPEPPVPQPTVA
ncbi:MAG: hypothetical protein HC860_16745 [Alkalinema sp. RU_4_3]|nr:hypothetical protein [Alkalinema sp. RU_4_3]